VPAGDPYRVLSSNTSVDTGDACGLASTITRSTSGSALVQMTLGEWSHHPPEQHGRSSGVAEAPELQRLHLLHERKARLLAKPPTKKSLPC